MNEPHDKRHPWYSVTWQQLLRFWYFFSIAVIIASLSFSKLGLSIGQFMLAGGWIAERITRKDFATAFKKFAGNRPAVIFSSILLLHFLGLIFTTDFDYAFKDLRTKFPLFLIPLLISTSQVMDRRSFYRLMFLFVLAVLVRSGYNSWMIATHRFTDIRDVSQNISHIIYSLQLALSIFILAFFLLKRNVFHVWHKGLMFVVLVWFFVYLIISQSFTGFAIVLITVLTLIPVLVLGTRQKKLKMLLITGFVAVFALVSISLFTIIRDYHHVNPVDYKSLEMTTSRGNPYIHDYYSGQTENGHLLWLYVQWDEMRAAWNDRSSIPFDSLNKKNEKMAYTVVRYLTSRGWRKDADAVERLTPGEISAIEKGVANYLFMNRFSIRGRVYEFLWGFDNYRKTGDPSGSTLMQRFEYWRASAGIIRDHWLTGVGTGDMNLAFQAQYEKMDSKLPHGQRWRSHNQFLSIMVGFGFFGFFWFLFSLLYPPLILRHFDDYFFLVFLIISLLSMLTGDTIESQTGVSFFVVFYTLFLFARKEKDRLFHAELK